MKPLYGEELLTINQQAASAAASVLSEAVVAASLCQSKIPFEMKAYGRHRWFGTGQTETLAIQNRIGPMEEWFASGGLPDSFIFAVAAGSVYAIEDKRKREQLSPGKVLKSWVRSGFRASSDPRPANPAVPADCQLLSLWLPIEPVKDRAINRGLQAAAERAVAMGLPPVTEHEFVVARDAPTQGVIEALTQNNTGARPAVIIGGQVVGQVAAGVGAPPQLSVAERLAQLESLRATGVISDGEYAAKREQIIAEI